MKDISVSIVAILSRFEKEAGFEMAAVSAGLASASPPV